MATALDWTLVRPPRLVSRPPRGYTVSTGAKGIIDHVARPIVVGVDDDLRVRESIESLVESAGYAPLVFASAEAFLQSGTLAGATCVIADVRMPGMDGIDLQRRIRRERPRLPVIFISAHYEDDVRQQALDGGAIEFLYKPFDADDLLRAIDHALKEE